MRPHKSTILIALVVFLLTALVAVMAQQAPSQSADQKKQTESCCAMDASCCKDGSCPMMAKEGASENSADCANCGNSGSCDMANHANHAKHDKKSHAGDGSCCKAKNKDAKQKDAKEKIK